MDKKRSKGVTFWGNLLIYYGIIYAIIKTSRNLQTWDDIVLPTLSIIVGIGILNLKNWARYGFLMCAMILIFTGIPVVNVFLKSINYLSKEKLLLFVGLIAVIMRFLGSIAGIIFFTRPKVKEQFNQ